MDQGTRTTVSDPTDGAPYNGVAQGNGGDARTSQSDLRAELDALLKENLSSLKDDIVKSAADRAVRDTQRFVDSRFSRTDAMLQQLAQNQQQVNRHFQAAEEADLEPEERKVRDLTRQLEETTRIAYGHATSARQWAAYAQVVDILGTAQLAKEDPRVIAIWDEDQMRQNPEQWVTTMATQIARIKLSEGETRNRTQAEAQQVAERRRLEQTQQRAAVMQSNDRRAQDAGQVDTATPSGGRSDWYERYRQLKSQGKNAEARQFMEAAAKRAARGDVRDVTQL